MRADVGVHRMRFVGPMRFEKGHGAHIMAVSGAEVFPHFIFYSLDRGVSRDFGYHGCGRDDGVFLVGFVGQDQCSGAFVVSIQAALKGA